MKSTEIPMKKNAWLLCFILLAGCVFSAFGGDNADLTPEEAFGRIFAKDSTGVAAMFDPGFLKQVSEAKLQEIAKFYTNEIGDFKKVETLKEGYTLHFASGTVPSRLKIDANNRISSLWFGVPEKTNDSFAAINETFQKSPDRTSVCILRYPATVAGETLAKAADDKLQPEVVIELNASQPMAIGSSFKLFLLRALEDEVLAGQRTWQDIVELREDWKSFPSGILQDWHAGSRHTLETLAGLMISLSDNTATDHVFNLLGAETIRKYFPESCRDVLNTSQVLKMKFFFPGKAADFIKADAAGKTAILREIDAITPGSIASYSSIYSVKNPVLIDELEWHITTRKLCETIYTLRDSKIIRINPASGLVDRADWHFVGFKGGSEPGVLNYTWVLQKNPDSPVYTVSCTANNSSKPIDNDVFNVAVTRILNLLKSEK